MKNIFSKFFVIISFLIIYNFTFNINNCESQWEPEIRLTNDRGNSYTSFNNANCITASGNYVHIVWIDFNGLKPGICYKRSTDYGITWEPDKKISDYLSASWYPSIAVSGQVLHVVWNTDNDRDHNIHYRRSTDRGTTWESEIQFTFNSDNSKESYYPSVSVYESFVHAVWKDKRDGNSEIYYKRSTDQGTSWEPDVRLTNDEAQSDRPSVSVYDNVVHVVWVDERDGKEEVYYKRSTDKGSNWESDKRLTFHSLPPPPEHVGSNTLRPCFAVSGSFVHIVWSDRFIDKDDAGLYYKCSTDDGITWSNDKQLTNNVLKPMLPTISVSGKVINLVWQAYSRKNDCDIFYKTSTNGGLNWDFETKLTDDTYRNYGTFVTQSDKVVHVVYVSSHPSYYGNNTEIYYKRNPTGNLIKK